MNVAPTPLAGAFVVEVERHTDERGSFARTFDADVLRRRGLEGDMAQASLSCNARAGTLRGLHFQVAPHVEAKLVRVVHGAIFDVIVDLRPSSATFCRWHALELTDDNDLGLFVPPGFAHGFQTLVDDTKVLYMMSSPYVPAAGSGVRWDDPAFGIQWPPAPPAGRVMSARDAQYPDFAP